MQIYIYHKTPARVGSHRRSQSDLFRSSMKVSLSHGRMFVDRWNPDA